MSRTPEQAALYNARTRCRCKKTPYYKNYGGRGIKCLLSSADDIIADIGPRPSPKHSLDRINNNDHYRIGNIRWATRAEQNTNKRPVSKAGRKRMSDAAKARCTPEWRKKVSKRVKKQHKAGKFGRATW